MTNREKALELVGNEMDRIESGSTMPDTQDVMSYALILILADISEQLSNIMKAAWTHSEPGRLTP